MRIAACVALLLLAAAPAGASEHRFLRTALFFEFRSGGGYATSLPPPDFPPSAKENSWMAMATITVGARLLDRLQLGIGYLPLLHWIFGESMQGLINAALLSTTVDLVKFLDGSSWFARGGFYAGGAETGGTQPVVGFNLATGVRFGLNRILALGFEVGVLGDFIDPGSQAEQHTYGGCVAFDCWLYVVGR
jgi:hypothetical protein